MRTVGLIFCLTFLLYNIGNSQKHLTRYDDTFKKYSKRFFGPGFDWKLFKAQGIAESQLTPEATSYVGARGIMQLMPSTFKEVKSKNPDFKSIEDPEWNIGAGIYYDRTMYVAWKDIKDDSEKIRFTFGSYNAGRGTILKAQTKAKIDSLDHTSWESISNVAHKVPKWRYKETLNYIENINQYHKQLEK
ncbi:MAG: transglycosylase SLT domain-containing protein [Ignavibacteriaceae bacterium]|nr:transglycosylase SLT domain-containing protein [Ignavibacteriaceae bacterium]